MLQYLLSCTFNIPVTSASTRLRLPEDDADTSKHVGVLTVHKLIYIYIYICAFVGLDNKLNRTYSMYIKIFLMNLKPELCLSKEGTRRVWKVKIQRS
jgi:hypothetical protein